MDDNGTKINSSTQNLKLNSSLNSDAIRGDSKISLALKALKSSLKGTSGASPDATIAAMLSSDNDLTDDDKGPIPLNFSETDSEDSSTSIESRTDQESLKVENKSSQQNNKADWDEKPVCGEKKTFEEILEEKLKLLEKQPKAFSIGDVSFNQRMQDIAVEEEHNESELRRFEQLEEFANENGSFVSNTAETKVSDFGDQESIWENEADIETQVAILDDTIVEDEIDDFNESTVSEKDVKFETSKTAAITENCPAAPSNIVNNPEPDSQVDHAMVQTLVEKMKSLDAEISRFKLLNSTLKDNLKNVEQEKDSLAKAKSQIFKEKEEELANLKNKWADENKKLINERRLLELQRNSLGSAQTKQFRQEIENLRKQLKDVEEKRDAEKTRTRNKEKRLENRILLLENENKELSEALKQRESQRLGSWKNGTNIDRNSINSANNDIPNSKPDKISKPTLERTRMRSSSPISSDVLKSNGPLPSPLNRDVKTQPTPGSSRKTYISTSMVFPSLEGKFEEAKHTDGKLERIFENGAREIIFPNGSKKTISSDGFKTLISFFNGDWKLDDKDKSVYFYKVDETLVTTHQNGVRVLEFKDGQVEKHYPDGTKEVTFDDSTYKLLLPSGIQECIYPNGTVVREEPETAQKLLLLPNGQREVHSAEYKVCSY
ncbi:DgyrCDS12055 [Dimorphilus gyrociliatus]|uniref:DgyrCDS12055 n=1 Tax=Dimorphilus gyrociliatus TaxID=2664684 RepID=A0A7I8W5F5_9ANNE|nr:DgyrCDS12055 [Dimorphilus gyrociliatus]